MPLKGLTFTHSRKALDRTILFPDTSTSFFHLPRICLNAKRYYRNVPSLKLKRQPAPPKHQPIIEIQTSTDRASFSKNHKRQISIDRASFLLNQLLIKQICTKLRIKHETKIQQQMCVGERPVVRCELDIYGQFHLRELVVLRCLGIRSTVRDGSGLACSPLTRILCPSLIAFLSSKSYDSNFCACEDEIAWAD